jgi:methylenetetrahydrofolate reductase (NADPH)
MNGIQLEMNFDGPGINRFREKLDNGIFQVIVEVTPPAGTLPAEDALARFADIEYTVSARNDLHAILAFNDNSSFPDGGMDCIRFASALCKMDRDKHLLCISGLGRTPREIGDLLAHASSEGFRNVLAVSGNSIPGDSVKQAQTRPYTESVHILESIRSHFQDTILGGCAVNPYCYIPETSYAQYFKLIKKINNGASFIVTQYGWDMRKLQELRWYLSSRGMHLPSIARFLMLTPERARELCSGKVPGIHISPDLEGMLHQEMSHSMGQFEAAQWRRIQIHAAGARFLGYSGIQIAGVERPDQIHTLLNRISEAMKEFSSFEDWLHTYCEYYDRLDLAPYPFRFYEFEDLFSSAKLPEQFVHTPAEIRSMTAGEKFRYDLASRLLAHADTLPANEKYLTKKLLVSCKSCANCRLPLTQFVCPENCPKHLANGPCGAVKVDGICEFGHQECIHIKRMRIASLSNDYVSLEETVIPPAGE